MGATQKVKKAREKGKIKIYTYIEKQMELKKNLEITEIGLLFEYQGRMSKQNSNNHLLICLTFLILYLILRKY